MTINEERMKAEFSELVSIDAESSSEGAMAERMRGKLIGLGFAVQTDPKGNLYGSLPGDLPGEPLLLSAHLDTVKPGIGKQAVFHEDGRITSGGDTVLGSDDVAGLTEILEGIRAVTEAGMAHRPIEILFPVEEELAGKGSAAVDYGRIHAKEAYVLDLSGGIGTAAFRAPTILHFTVCMKGRAAHAGFAPQDGIHAIALMTRAISHITQGRFTDESGKVISLNIGKISGGVAENIVPESCFCAGEIRGFDHEAVLNQAGKLRRLFEKTAAEAGADCSVQTEIKMTAYETDREEAVVQRFLKACRKLRLEGTLVETYGGSDQNNFALHGIKGLVLSCGMREVHSVREFIRVEDLLMGANLVAELIS